MEISKKYRIAVAGTGYVGLSMAVLLAGQNQVKALDIDKRKVDLINQRISPIQDKEIEEYLKEKELDLTATSDPEYAYGDAEYIIIATPTNYDSEHDYFDTSAVESVIKQVKEINPDACIECGTCADACPTGAIEAP